jgi:hypothetical protein
MSFFDANVCDVRVRDAMVCDADVYRFTMLKE